jgi:uncharacterized protein (DUF2126 family)
MIVNSNRFCIERGIPTKRHQIQEVAKRLASFQVPGGLLMIQDAKWLPSPERPLVYFFIESMNLEETG